MEIDYFWEFLILSETKSYSSAALRLFLSEPTLSRHIKALEEEYKAPLFERGAKGLELSEYGRALYPYAKNLVETVNQSRTSIRTIKARHDSALRITSAYPISGIISVFSQDNPDIFCHVIDNRGVTETIIENLMAGNLDLAIVRNAPDDDRLEKIPFAKDYYAAVMSSNHHLANRRKVRMSELKSERFISFASDQDCNNTLIRLCNEAGFEPDVVAISANGLEAASITKYGGIAILMGNTMKDHRSINNSAKNSLSIVELDPHIEIDVSIVYPKSRGLSSDAQRFVDYVSEVWLPAYNEGIV